MRRARAVSPPQPLRAKRKLSVSPALGSETGSESDGDEENSTTSSGIETGGKPQAELDPSDLITDSDSSSGDDEDALKSEPLPSRTNLPVPPQNPKRERSLGKTAEKPTFQSLGISASLVSSLSAMSIRNPTPVQASCIPWLLSGNDCIGNAKTGSGKTVAFALPILQKLSVDPYGIFALVLTPTRELAFQISEQFVVLGAPLNVRSTVVVGGMDMMTQALALNERPHIVIATPGRLVDHLTSKSGEWSLDRVKFLVLDEADRLLTSTFASDLTTIFATLPQDRQTCLFTATLSPAIETLASATPRPGKQKPLVHRDKSTVETVDTLKQHFILVPSHVREVYLYYLLCNPPESVIRLRRTPPQPSNPKSRQKTNSHTQKTKSKSSDPDAEIIQPPPTIIFVRHPKTASYLTILLQHLGIRSTALHSQLSQPARLSSLSLFRAAVVPVLICTDVGARGLDMDDVGMVINWDLPGDEGGAEEYVHRVGRTARMGRGGFAISFVTEREGDDEIVGKIEDRIRTKLTEFSLPEEKVLDKLNLVATAKRTASMELHDSHFGKRHEINRIKRKKIQQSGS